MPKTRKVIQSLNAGELSPLMDQRIDQSKYAAGCRTMENMIPLIYGGAQERPGLEFIAAQKSSSAKGRLVSFEHSVDDTYILLFENQVIRAFKDGAQVLDGVGTEDLSGLDNLVAHWLLNESEGTTAADDDGGTHDGTISVDASTVATTGKVGSGSFDLDGQYDVEVSDHNDFSFTDNSDDTPFSMVCWAYVTEQSDIQVLLSKWKDVGTTSEWRLSLSVDRELQLHLADASVDLSADRIAHWKLNDDAANTAVDDDVAVIPHDGVASANTSVLNATGKVGTGSFDMDGQYLVTITDHNDFSFDDSGSNPFSIAAWIFVTNSGTIQRIITKNEGDPDNFEWSLELDASEKLNFRLFDQSEAAEASRKTDAPLSADTWHFVVATYDSTGGATAANGITLYVDGNLVASTATNDASYAAMENKAADVIIGANIKTGAGEFFFQDKIDNIAVLSKELSASDVSTLWNSGNGIEDFSGSNATVFAVTDDTIPVGWHFFAATYSAPSDETTAADGIILYVDGVAVDSTATNNANYTAMQGDAEEVRIGSQRNSGDSANEKFWADRIDEVSIFGDVLTPTEVASLYSTTALEITSPYLTADLPALKFEQSADVMFIAHPSYEPRKLSRLNDAVWTLAEADLQTGPFRDQNTDITKTITASATTGTVTLTATGHTPFTLGATAGHEPSGGEATSKSITGALYKLVHASSTPSVSEEIEADTLNDVSGTLAVPKGITWDFTTNGTWGAAGDPASVVLERSYDSGTTYETVVTVTSAANKNVTTSGTEETADAIYRARTSSACAADTNCSIQFSIRDTSHIGIVEITSVTSSTVATGTVLTTLGSTDLTHRWSEGSFSNRRGWPIDVTISSEERLTFAGNISEPLTTWGSVIGDFTDFKLGTDDDDALNLTLVGSGQQNRIRWILSKNTLVLGTVGGEHILGASKDDEALTPSNIRARLQTTYGSENIAAKIVNQAVLFVQRGGRKIREFLYNFEQDSHKADDLTVFAEHITESGIVDMAFQRTPDPILWCIRADGEMAVMTYERDQDVFSWSRLITQTNLAGTASDSDFESVAVIYGGANSEDEVWVTVRRTISGSDARYVERFTSRAMPSALADMKFLDSYITDTGGDTTIEGLTHLIGQTVQVLGDGLVQATKVVNGSGVITAATTAAKYQVGTGYTATVKPMKIDLNGLGLTVTKKINRGVFSVFETIGGEVGGSTSTLQDIPTGTAALFTGFKEIPLKDGYSRSGDILARQTQPLPMTVLSFSLDVGANND